MGAAAAGAGACPVSPPAKPNPAGALCYILDDEARTRRLKSLLLPVGLIVVALAFYPPAAAGVGAGVAALWAWQGRRRG